MISPSLGLTALVRHYKGDKSMANSEDTKTDGEEDLGDKIDGVKEELHEISESMKIIAYEMRNMPVGYDPQ